MGKEKPPEATPVVEQESGSLEVAESVFRALFKQAVSEVQGVASLSAEPAGIFHRSGEAVVVERGSGEVAFSVTLSVHYDVSIPDVAAELRKRVTAAIEGATGYRVRAVNVAIDHILPPEPESPEQAAPEGDNVPELPPVPDHHKE